MKRTVRAISASECITQRATPAATRLALYCEIELVQILRFELQGVQVFVGLGAARLVLGIETLCKTAGAVFASAAFLTGRGGTLGGYKEIRSAMRRMRWDIMIIRSNTYGSGWVG